MHNKRNKTIDNSEPSGNIEGTIHECVHFILCREGSKIPIKRSEIKDHLNTTCQMPPSEINGIIVQAEKLLKRIYGYKLVQIPSKTGIQYIAVLEEPCEESFLSTTVDLHQRQLLIAVLTHIFMSGGSVKDGDMWTFLSEAGLLKETDNAGKKILTNLFTKQHYLTYTKVGESELAKHIFQWGQRAKEEVPKMFLLKKMAKALDREPSDWTEQYKDCSL
ncbi:unnamed protein product [Leptosia nina]|uniref:MAGE domain-containing protein n=1 Tax=Leptosia nina TaxID=320188 RepID=A0AAV1K597_9NEOP